jgi:hypothetical protein
VCRYHNVVAGALDDEGFSGKSYLDEIHTVTGRVPEFADHQIGQLLVDGLNAMLRQHLPALTTKQPGHRPLTPADPNILPCLIGNIGKCWRASVVAVAY